MNIEWLGHAGFRIAGSRTVCIDPFQMQEGEKADLVLITHPHYDHCSPADLKKIAGPETVIIAPIGCQSKIAAGRFHYAEFRNIQPGGKVSIYGAVISAVPAYNIGKKFHNRHDDWVGYVIELDGKRFYHAGDTDFINEMAGIKADVAFLPVGGTYTMDAREAAHAAAIIRPKIAVPMHYGSIVGSADDAEKFEKSVAHSRVEIMQKGIPEELI